MAPGTDDDEGQDLPPDDVLDCGTDKAKFVKAANAGLPAIVRVEIAGTIYDCEATGDFIFKKKVFKVAEDEPKKMKDLLGGKSLTARYKKGCFNADWVNTITLGIEACEGTLREAILRIIKELDKDKGWCDDGAELQPDNVAGEKKILIIYHDWGMTESCKNLLEGEGFTAIRAASDREDGLAVARSFKPDLILLGGLHIPSPKEGLEFCQLLHSLPETKKAKLMVITGHFLQEYVTELLCYGVSVYIEKPFDPEKYIETVKEVLS